MAFFDFLDNSLFKPIGKGFSEVDRFVDREMPFDSGWGLPAAVVAAIAAPQLIPYFAEAGAAEGAGAAAGSTGGSFGGAEMLSSLGGDGGSFGGDLFQLGGSTGGSMGGGGGFMDSLGSLFGGNDGGFGIGKGANYTNFANTSGGSFGNLNSMPSPSGSEYGLNFGSPSSIASSNSSMGLTDLSPSGGNGLSDFFNQTMKNQQKTAQQNQGIFDSYQPTQVIRQAAFLPNPSAVNVQDKQTDLAALIKALRG
jgi:hypothetical protein